MAGLTDGAYAGIRLELRRLERPGFSLADDLIEHRRGERSVSQSHLKTCIFSIKLKRH